MPGTKRQKINSQIVAGGRQVSGLDPEVSETDGVDEPEIWYLDPSVGRRGNVVGASPENHILVRIYETVFRTTTELCAPRPR